MEILSVSDLNRVARLILENDPLLQEIWVRGELSNVKAHTSGHLYFSLKDDTSSVKAVMFRGRAQTLLFRPENGQQVLCRGRASIFERDGAFQLYVEEMEPAGLGAQHLAFLQLKEKLEAEGLFDADRKRPLPPLPTRVGVVTSETGAAVRDIFTVLRRRHPRIGIVLAPVQVQGEAAPPLIAKAISDLAQYGRVDVIIVGRGGGSQEDLWAFNAELVVRAVAACPVPTISAVGHEVDVTLVDYAADRRAPTPSAAAEMAVPVFEELELLTEGLSFRVRQAQARRIRSDGERLHQLTGRRVMTRPRTLLEPLHARVASLERGLARGTVEVLLREKARFLHLAGRLDGLSPLGALARGFAVIQKEGKVIRDAGQLQVGDGFRATLGRGSFSGRVEAIDIDV